MLRQFISYAAVGMLGTVTHFLMLYLMVESVGVGPVASSMVGFVCAVVVTYSLSRRLVFRSRLSHRRGAPRFLAVASVGLLLNSLLMAILTGMTTIHYLLCQAVAAVVVLIWNFLSNRYWTFAELSDEKGVSR